MKAFASLIILVLLSVFAASAQNKINIACVGNSITFGAGVKDRSVNSYPAQLQTMLGDRYQVNNFGVSGATLLSKGNLPYIKQKRYQAALVSNPDIVLIKLGTNDSKLMNRVHIAADFDKDYTDLVNAFRMLPSHPRIVLMTPVTAFGTDTSSIWDKAITSLVIPRIQNIAYKQHLEVLNMHALFMDQEALVPDKIHPNAEGATIIAKRIAELIQQKRDTTFNIFNKVEADKNFSSFYGYECADFTFDGRACKIVKPKFSAPNHPWIWRARFWGHEPQTDIALLERGFHLVYCDVAELYGNQQAINHWNAFYKLVRKAGLAKKAVLEGMSRGGVYIYNWAALNRKKVACTYADNPVLDLSSWPGGFGKGPGAKFDLDLLKKDYNLSTDEEVKLLHNSPIDKVKQIVKGGYPMLHLLGDADEVVPADENTILFEQKVKEAGGNITVILKPGFKHHPHSLPNPTPIVDFILNHVKL